jgi:glycosyltransferase involved in cell wall biosynthesis
MADEVIVHTPSAVSGTYRRKVNVIPHGTCLFTWLKKNETLNSDGNGTFKMVSPGFIRPGKRYDWCIGAVKGMRNVEYAIIGSHQDKQGEVWLDKLKKMVNLLGVKNIKIVDKFFKEKELVETMSESHVVVLPYNDSSQSGSGILHLAFSLGKPVIAPCYGEFLEHSEAIEYFNHESNQASSIRKAAVKLMKHELYQRKELKAKEYSEATKFENIAKLTSATYAKLLSK